MPLATGIIFVVLAVIILWQRWALQCYREALWHQDKTIRVMEYRLGEGPMPDEVREGIEKRLAERHNDGEH